jgi:hypothetical protein
MAMFTRRDAARETPTKSLFSTLSHSPAAFPTYIECLLTGRGGWSGDVLADKGTPEFYREQAIRLTGLAAAASTPEIRIELLEIAAVFQKLAEHLAANKSSAIGIDAETA